LVTGLSQHFFTREQVFEEECDEWLEEPEECEEDEDELEEEDDLDSDFK